MAAERFSNGVLEMLRIEACFKQVLDAFFKEVFNDVFEERSEDFLLIFYYLRTAKKFLDYHSIMYNFRSLSY